MTNEQQAACQRVIAQFIRSGREFDSSQVAAQVKREYGFALPSREVVQEVLKALEAHLHRG